MQNGISVLAGLLRLRRSQQVLLENNLHFKFQIEQWERETLRFEIFPKFYFSVQQQRQHRISIFLIFNPALNTTEHLLQPDILFDSFTRSPSIMNINTSEHQLLNCLKSLLRFIFFIIVSEQQQLLCFPLLCYNNISHSSSLNSHGTIQDNLNFRQRWKNS